MMGRSLLLDVPSMEGSGVVVTRSKPVQVLLQAHDVQVVHGRYLELALRARCAELSRITRRKKDE